MLTIRLTRTGKKGQPNYRIVVADSRKAVSSPYIEMIGHYDPKTKALVLNQEKAQDWMNKGAKPSNTVAKLFTKEKMDHKSIVVKKYRKISKKELERIKAEEEVEKAKEQAEKEAAKEAFDAQVEAEKEANDTVDPLMAAAEEAISEIKEEAAEKAEAKAESVEEPVEIAVEKTEEKITENAS
jgi:small subunit ribosomal protein S16